ncbi:MAG: HAD-IC family P-type ATPase [Phycisphaerales bacterium]
MPAEKIAGEMGVDPESGLSTADADERVGKYGKNQLRQTERANKLKILVRQFKSMLIMLLAAAGLVSVIFARWMEGGAILAVILVNTLIGFFTELKAMRSMEALREMAQAKTTVRRDGKNTEIPAEELVPGDVVILEAGDVVAADLRIIKASKLEANESALTGESQPVGKGTDTVEADTDLAERTSMLYKGTVISRGSAEGVVVAHGMDTELGRIASLVEEAEQSATPLEQRLEKLGRMLIWITLAVAAVTIVVGLLRGKETLLMVETGIALAVASIPEGLPIVATLALARGMHRMAKRNALINRLSAVETLGSTGVIFSDKTGTLTENQMTVTRYTLASGEVRVEGLGLTPEGAFLRDEEEIDPGENDVLLRAIEVGVLCNKASIDSDEETEGNQDDEDEHEGDGGPEEDSEVEEEDSGIRGTGDPMEVALLIAGAKAGIDRSSLLEKYPEEREEAFDPDTRAMATYHKTDSGYRVAVKGSPESVIEACTRIYKDGDERDLGDDERNEWHETCDRMAKEGSRVLALAQKHCDSVDEEPYEDLTLIGAVGMHDPPREEAGEAIERCRDAGITVIMVTGDQPGTAVSVAGALSMTDGDEPRVVTGRDLRERGEGDGDGDDDLLGVTIYARMEPAQKLRLIGMHQDAGSVVAMTGDGINDAPALKKADIGIAMGMRGTEAAKEAADMVLQDDNFETIVRAVEHGRTIFSNIRKAVIFMMCTNVAEVIAVSVAAFADWTLPLLPLQILYLNVMTDVFPALALSVGPGSGHEMENPPRDPDEQVLTRGHWMWICGAACVVAACVLGNMLLAENTFEMSSEAAITIAFITLGMSKLWFVFILRDKRSGIFDNEIVRNKWMWGALGICALLLVAAVYLPGLSTVLGTENPGRTGWLMILCGSLVPLILGQAWLIWTGRGKRGFENGDENNEKGVAS